MTESQYRHLVEFLRPVFGTSDFFLIGRREGLAIVLPDGGVLIAPREQEPFAYRNQFFSLSIQGAGASPEQDARLRLLTQKTEQYARLQPWFVDAVRARRPFLERSPALLRLLTETPGPCQAMFRDLMAVRAEPWNQEGPCAGLFDLDALESAVFRLASGFGPDEADALERAERHRWPPAAPAAWARDRRLLFVNLLHGAEGLSAELPRWISDTLGGVADEVRSCDEQEVERHAHARTTVFCVGYVYAEQTRLLLRQARRFERVVFVDLGLAAGVVPPAELLAVSNVTLVRAAACTRPGELPPAPGSEYQVPYIPVVGRTLVAHRLQVEPTYDFFVCANCEQDLSFLLRHEAFFSRRKLLIGTRPCPHSAQHPDHDPRGPREYEEVRRRIPGAVFLPELPRHLYLLVRQLARSIAIVYPPTWRKASFTLAGALLSGRGILTASHPPIGHIDPACFLLFAPGSARAERELEASVDDQESRRAAGNAERFARDQLELATVMQRVVDAAMR